tara:strand:- start:52 stop:393 length:342 start_codon:yes stop_codon:yes gene_type:complete
MTVYSLQYVSKSAPWLCNSEAQVVYEHIHATFKSLDLVHAADVRTIARQLFPYVQEQSKDDIAKLNVFRMSEAIASLEAAQKWLSKVSSPSDTVGMAIRDIGIIADQLQGVKQ